MDSQVAAKAVIQNENGDFLIVREKGRWQAVGGRLEKGEKLEDGLRRETREETGIDDLEIGTVVHVDEWFAKPEGIKKHIVAIFFACKTKAKRVQLSDEHQEYAWITPADLDNYPTLENEIKQAIRLASQL